MEIIETEINVESKPINRNKKYYNKDKHRGYVKKYIETHKEETKIRRRKYNQNNKEKHNKYVKKYVDKNKDDVNAKKRERYSKVKDKEEVKEKRKEYYRENKEKRQNYYQNNKDRIRDYQHDRYHNNQKIIKVTKVPEVKNFIDEFFKLTITEKIENNIQT
jgi:hypothetical protein